MTCFTVEQICDKVNPKEFKIIGNSGRHFTKPQSIWETSPRSISWCVSTRKDAIQLVQQAKASVIICNLGGDWSQIDCSEKTLLLVPEPRLIFAKVLKAFFVPDPILGIIHPSAIIHKEVILGANVSVGPHAIVGKCKIGKGCQIYANVVIYDEVEIGENVVIYAGAVIGSYGFGFVKDEKGAYERFPHLGGVKIDDDVEIGSNTTVDRGTLGFTTIGRGTKINNLCHVAHNTNIGMNCIINCGVTISGSVKIGDNSWIGPGVNIRDGIQVGKNVLIGMGSAVVKDVPDNQVVMGVPARPRNEFLRSLREKGSGLSMEK